MTSLASLLPGLWFFTNEARWRNLIDKIKLLSNCCRQESAQGNSAEAADGTEQNISGAVERDDGDDVTHHAKPYVIQVEEMGDDRVEWKQTVGRPVGERRGDKVWWKLTWGRPVGESSGDRVEQILTRSKQQTLKGEGILKETKLSKITMDQHFPQLCLLYTSPRPRDS